MPVIEDVAARLQRMNDESERYIAERRAAMSEDRRRWARNAERYDRFSVSVQMLFGVAIGALCFASGMLTAWALCR